MKGILLNNYCENEIPEFKLDIQKLKRNKYKLIICELVFLVFIIHIFYLIEFYFLIFVSITVLSLVFLYTIHLIEKLKNIEQSVEYISLLKPEFIYLSKNHVLGQKKNLYIVNAYSFGNECNGIGFVNMLENRSVL